MVLAPLALLPMSAAGTVLTAGSIALVAVVLTVFGDVWRAGTSLVWAVAWLLLAVLLLEPVRSELAYGQVDIVLMSW